MVVIGCDGILTFRLGTKDINKWWVFRPVEAIVILDLVGRWIYVVNTVV